MSGNFEVLPCGTQARLAAVEAERDALKAENERLYGMLSAASWHRAQEEHNALRAEREALLEACTAMLTFIERHAPRGLQPEPGSPVAMARAAIALCKGCGNG